MENKSLKQKISYYIFRILRATVDFVYPEISIEGTENLPEGSCILVGNHAQMNGPIIGELYIPGRHYTWCAGEMLDIREVPAYAYRDFWSLKPAWCRWFYRLLSYIIAPLCACIFNNAATIPVYRDSRSISTFRSTVKALEEGARVTIFPEKAEPFNNILYSFQEGFVDVARLYWKKQKEALPFVPVYIAPELKKVYLGKPVYFDPQAPIAEERKRICRLLMDSITDIAQSLPAHTVVPYLNIPKRDYPKNIPSEVKSQNEKASC